jgi:hypothetical protein
MPRVKSSPFSRHEDIPAFMVGFLAREAEAEGKPLTEQEVGLLGAPVRLEGLTWELRARVQKLIERVMQKDEPRSPEDSRTFLTAIEWADMEDALVVEMSVDILSRSIWRIPPRVGSN